MKTLLLAATVFLLLQATTCAQSIRPVHDDVGFCWDATQMKRLVEHLENAETDKKLIPDIVAAVVPHDDYLYSARVAYPLFKSLRAGEVVVFGVTHASVRKEIGDHSNILILDNYQSWIGPYGSVKISRLRDFLLHRLDSSIVRVDSRAHALEHSIEAVIPFMQHFNPELKITPIMVTAMSLGRLDTLSGILADALAEYAAENRLLAGRDIAFVISSDANHYGTDFNNAPLGLDARAHQAGTENDRRIIGASLTGPINREKIVRFTEAMESVSWCGKYSVPFGLFTVQKLVHTLTARNLVGTLLRYSDTYSDGVLPLTKTGMGITAPFSLKHWVGFFSATYTIR